jgi:NAD(P)-dependent dehydrogenase (short-subunit alcohol dehydrogenase family)
MRLKEKVILITGSTTGIGEAMARSFARKGLS